jgi:hypothetical protein
MELEDKQLKLSGHIKWMYMPLISRRALELNLKETDTREVQEHDRLGRYWKKTRREEIALKKSNRKHCWKKEETEIL